MMTQPKRYHPAWLLFELYSFIKNTVFFIVFLFVLRSGTNSGWILWAKYAFIFFAVWTLIHIVLKWFVQTYQITNQSIILREGVLVRNQRTVPFERIQNNQTSTNFLHRMLGLTSLSLETGTSDAQASVKFTVLSTEEAQQILKAVNYQNATETEETEEIAQTSYNRTFYFRSTKKDTLKAAFTSLSFLAIFPILAAVYFQIDDFFSLESSAENIFFYFANHLWMLIPLFIIAMILSVAIGYVQTVIKYGNYEISADEERIYIQKGVLSTSSFSIPKKKVQAITIHQSFIKRMLNMAEVKLVSAGKMGDGKQETNSLYPFMAKKEAYRLTNVLLPDYQIEENMKRLPRKVLLLKLISPYFGTLIVGAGLFIFQREWLWIAGIVFLLGIASRVLDYLFTSYLRHGDFIQTRKGGFSNETFLTRKERVQQIEVRHSWLQRKFNVATLEFSNRSKPVYVSQLADVPKEDVSDFYRWFKQKS
ncbi:PH domain-containing protein [Jeotgalibacillus proteolyticus]|uniref:PH domain-containing protein n=1 Tax=Jeotgalibacillus proteolyticus TaxID=2082395 RepID=UPI003CF8A03C